MTQGPGWTPGPPITPRTPPTLVLAAVAAILLSSLAGAFALLVGTLIVAHVEERSDLATAGFWAAFGPVLVTFVGCCGAFVGAVLTLWGLRWARLLLVLCLSVGVLLPMLWWVVTSRGSSSLLYLVPLGGCVASIALLYVGGANQWFSHKEAQRAQARRA